MIYLYIFQSEAIKAAVEINIIIWAISLVAFRFIDLVFPALRFLDLFVYAHLNLLVLSFRLLVAQLVQCIRYTK